MDEIIKILRGMSRLDMNNAVTEISMFLSQENARRRVEDFLNENLINGTERIKIELNRRNGEKAERVFVESGVMWEWEK